MDLFQDRLRHKVFIETFANEENLPEIYQSLLPESGERQSKENFKVITLKPGLIDPLAMEVCFLNTKDNRLVFVVSNSLSHKFDMDEFESYAQLYFDELIEEGIDVSNLDTHVIQLDTETAGS